MSEADKDFWLKKYNTNPEYVQVEDILLLDEVADLPVGSALDLGCGIGKNAINLAARGWYVVGIDWIEKAIEIANNKAITLGVNAKFYVGNITSWIPFQKFDLVFSTYAIPGRQVRRKKMIQTALKALAKGGTTIVIEWEKSMTKAWKIDEDDLPSLDDIILELKGLVIEKAEVISIQNKKMSPDDPRYFANTIVVKARNSF